MRVRWPELALLTLTASTAYAGRPTLIDAWQGVVAHSPEYAAALARRDAGSAARDMARALWMPTLSAQGGAARRSIETATTGAQFSAPGFGVSNGVDFRTHINGGNFTQWALVAQQPIIDAGRSADAQSARARAAMADAQFRLTEQALMLKTAEAVAATVESGARLRAVQLQRQSAMRSRDMAHERFEAGDLPVTEWREAQARADRLAVEELDAQQAFAIANEAYSNLTGLVAPGKPADTGFRPEPAGQALDEGSAAEPVPLADWLRRAKDASPALALQAEQRGAAEAEARRWSRKEDFQLNLVGQFGRESLNGSGDYGDAGATQRLASLGLQVTVPLFSGGMRSAQRHAADASLRAANADLEAAQQQVDLQTRSAWLAAGNAMARLRAMRRAQESAESRLDATRIGHEAGERTLLDLLSAEGDALQARAGTVGAGCEGMLATLRLAAAAGTLDEAALRNAAGGEFACGEDLKQ